MNNPSRFHSSRPACPSSLKPVARAGVWGTVMPEVRRTDPRLYQIVILTGQQAVDHLIRDFDLERIFGFKPGVSLVSKPQ